MICNRTYHHFSLRFLKVRIGIRDCRGFEGLKCYRRGLVLAPVGRKMNPVNLFHGETYLAGFGDEMSKSIFEDILWAVLE